MVGGWRLYDYSIPIFREGVICGGTGRIYLGEGFSMPCEVFGDPQSVFANLKGRGQLICWQIT